ncbi:MAG: hypothetical protein B6241_05215 [Spirochaetaceae bacterium 4572_59]|nr:MAG: hypothetical protein B6241_05215 [Spirochaetaceae bacterium 4572_59]
MSLVPQRFKTKIFLSLLLTGFIQVLLLGMVSILFSNRMIEETFSKQSSSRMEMLVSRMNLTLQEYRELSKQLSRDEQQTKVLFSPDSPGKEELSRLYQNLYKELAGNIEKASIHLINQNGSRLFSSHVLPTIYNPNSSDQSLSTYIKLKKNRTAFPMIDSFINPRGERVAISFFNKLKGKDGQSGFLIMDLNTGPIADSLEQINADFFTDIYLMDHISLKMVSLFREDESGNFSAQDWRVPPGESGILKYDKTLVAYAPLYSDELMLVGTLELDTVTDNLVLLIRIILIISIIGLVFSSMIALSLARTITQPLRTLVAAMKKMEKGNLDFRLKETNGDEFDILIHGFNDMAHQIQDLMESRLEREKALHTAERHALQSQINPHFLYNTLNTVKSLSKLHGIDDITIIITQLGKLLRNAMGRHKELSTIAESIELVEGYLQIQKIRFGNSFNWEIYVDESFKNFILPRLIIQPIVENAVIHGLEKLIGEKKIVITAEEASSSVLIKDNGTELNEKIWQDALANPNGIGLYNVNKRLKLYYGEDAGLFCTKQDGQSIIRIQLGELKEE